MKKIIWCIFLTFGFATGMLLAQTLKEPWQVFDGGGGKSSGASLTLTSSIGQPNIERAAGTGITLEDGYIPGIRWLGGTTSMTTQQLGTQWNMISVPLVVNDYQKSTLYPTASNAYTYNGTYHIASTLQNGVGFWVRYDLATSVNISGSTFQAETLNVLAGWNMIGPPSYPVLLADITPVGSVVQQSPYYYYSTVTGYLTEDTLKPGMGYWIKVDQAGQLAVHSGSIIAPPSAQMVAIGDVRTTLPNSKGGLPSGGKQIDGVNRLTVRDGAGRERGLNYTFSRKDIDLHQFELPPLPPAGMLDVRFASQRSFEMLTQSDGSRQVFPIQIRGAVFPLTIGWENIAGDAGDAALEVRVAGEKPKTYSLRSSGQAIVDDEEKFIEVRLTFSPSHPVELPKVYALYQNFPNPFNPTTEIRYDVPQKSSVAVKVYNLLGEEVATLVDEEKSAGSFLVKFDGSNYPSGIYFYRMQARPLDAAQAGEYMMTRKLVLMK